MAFLTPLALTLSLLAVPILILYMLKLRRREVEVPSTLLWQMLLRDREANAPWQRLRRNLLLFVQLLLLAALVLALARPFLPVRTIAAGTLVVLIDGSASMQATDGPGGTSRFEAARAAARGLIDGLRSGGRMALILVGHQPEVLSAATADPQALREALARAQPEEGAADWEAAFALAAGSVRAASVSDSVVVIISDGGLPRGLPPLPGEVRYVPVGTSADNLAVAALALRAAPGGPQLFASVTNYGPAARDAILSFSVNGQLSSAERVSVPAGGTASVVLKDLPAEPAVYQARLTPPSENDGNRPLDALPLDDTAWAAYQPPGGGRVLVVSPGNVFLEQVLTALSKPLALRPFRLRAGEAVPTEPFDLYVFDGNPGAAITGTLPAGDLLLINPTSNDLLAVGGTFSNTTGVRVADDPLTRYVDWSGVHLLKARQVTAPNWARVLVDSDGGPLVLAGETGGRRVAVLTFDLHDSDLPLQVTFPVLMANLLNYLVPAQAFSAPDGLRPGETLTIKPRGGDTGLAVTDPAGQAYAATATEAGVVFADTLKLGVYTVASNQGVLGRFAVNLFNPAESRIAPAPTITVGRSDISAAAPEAQGEYELWPWLAALAFALLLIEWWIYHRGATLPAARGWKGWFVRKKAAEHPG
jgi:Ca-activated chloride channel family protein